MGANGGIFEDDDVKSLAATVAGTWSLVLESLGVRFVLRTISTVRAEQAEHVM